MVAASNGIENAKADTLDQLSQPSDMTLTKNMNKDMTLTKNKDIRKMKHMLEHCGDIPALKQCML